MASPQITAPTFEHHHNGLGINTATPRVSWRFKTDSSTASDWKQTSFTIEHTFTSDKQTQTFETKSEDSVLVQWQARPLKSREAATVRVKVFGKGKDGVTESEWSEPSRVETALLEDGDFRAGFITSAGRVGPNGPLQPLRFRKVFDAPKADGPARLYITSLGVFNVWINGKPASDEHLAPGWTSYKHRLVYRTLDVSSLLRPGEKNVIAAEVAEGWYAGRLSFSGGERFRYGDELALLAQLEISAADAEPWRLVTDDSWETMGSAIATSEIYDGEVYHVKDELDDWASADWPSARVVKTKTLARPSAKLVAPDAPPVRAVETLAVKEVFKSKSGKTILDFGQNLVGKLSIPHLKLPEGQTLTLKHAEVMENGELGIRPLRVAKATDVITGASGKTLRDWSPSYTFHGFRYVEVSGWPDGEVQPDNFKALVLHTDMRRRGYFECSNEAVNQLHRNVTWSMRGNFLSVPTDCPQRDERLGWTGDLQAFAPTATFLYDTMGMLGNWLEDVSAEQLADNGVVPLVVPEAMPADWPREGNSQAIWGDVAVLAPEALFKHSSDKGLLERQFQSMKAWLDQGIKRATDGLWDPDYFQLADWLDPNAPPEDPAQATTDPGLVANAYLVHVTEVFARLCAALDDQPNFRKYTDDAQNLKAQFQARYITPEGNLVSLSQTGIALAIHFDLFPHSPSQRSFIASSLSRLVRKARFNISTGFAGTPVISHALTTIGQPQLAYRMLLETGCPSWLYPVVKWGATTIWERWDSMLEDGRINPGEMTSFNHYALGAVANWLHTSVGGISPQEPGWKVIKVRPVPGGNLKSAKVSFDGPFGLVSNEWTLTDSKFAMTLTVPPNSMAVVTLPHELRTDYGAEEEKSRTVGSGVHSFECECNMGEWPPQVLTHPFMKQPEASTIAGD